MNLLDLDGDVDPGEFSQHQDGHREVVMARNPSLTRPVRCTDAPAQPPVLTSLESCINVHVHMQREKLKNEVG
jgi:hypothetical protein